MVKVEPTLQVQKLKFLGFRLEVVLPCNIVAKDKDPYHTYYQHNCSILPQMNFKLLF